MNETNKRDPRFYFSLPRFIALLRGGDTRRAERNAVEAWFVGLMMYLVHYLFFAHYLPPRLAPWQTALLLIVLAFWVWLFWLLLLYLNSVIIKLLHLGGLFRTVATRRAQSIFWGLFTTAMACALLEDSPWVREIGAIWLVAVAMNLASAVVLALSNATRASGK
ncbi:MAG TPA: hypothetical protein VGW39_05000 [Chthoniobacterales bacterium]|nr:hypothetical protein [Chthoniobacterales bacterium]